MFCYDLAKSSRFGANRIGTDGSGAVAKRHGIYVLVGMSLSSEEEWRKPLGKPRGKFLTAGSQVADVLSICHVLPWLKSVIDI